MIEFRGGEACCWAGWWNGGICLEILSGLPKSKMVEAVE